MSYASLKRAVKELDACKEDLKAQEALLPNHPRSGVSGWRIAVAVGIGVLLLGILLILKGLEPAPMMGHPVVRETIIINSTRNVPVVQEGLKDCVELRNDAGEVFYRCRVRL